MALNTLPAGAFADDAISSDKINLANNFAFTGTVTGASGMDFIQQFTWTGVDNFQIARTFSDYEVYKLFFYDVQFTQDDVNLIFDVSADSGSSYAAYNKRTTGLKNNRGASDNNFSSSLYGATGTAAQTIAVNCGGNDTAETHNFEATFYNLNHANRYTNIFFNNSFSRTGDYSEMGLVHMMVLGDVAINALKWTISGSGNFGGTAELYGVKLT